MCVVQIMVDDAAAIVITLAPEPKQAAKNLQAPAAACVASVSNGVANSVEAKAARDKLAALPYQNFFRHLQLVLPMSLLFRCLAAAAWCCQQRHLPSCVLAFVALSITTAMIVLMELAVVERWPSFKEFPESAKGAQANDKGCRVKLTCLLLGAGAAGLFWKGQE